MQTIFVTGAAGFIGSNLVDRLLAERKKVIGWDNFSTGQTHFLENALQHPNFSLVRGDNLDLTALTAAMKGCDFVFHLAANADIKDGWSHPRKDLEQNTIASFFGHQSHPKRHFLSLLLRHDTPSFRPAL